MPITFVHTADWQIGKAFGRFPADVVVRLKAARLDAIDRVAGVARSAGAGHVLVAGDVIDSELLDDATLRQPLARMAAYPSMIWHLLPGNHDPSRPGGVWERMQRLGLPGNVVPHLTPTPHEIAPGVWLLASPLTAKESLSDPTIWMEAAATPECTLRLGMAHGSVKGFGSLGEASVPIDAHRRVSAGLDYFALGDWHGLKEIVPAVWYAGTPEPDSFANNGPGHAIVVRLEGPGATAEVTPIRTATCDWSERRVVLNRLADIEPIEAEVAAAGPAQRFRVMALSLEGALTVGERALLDRRLEALASGLLCLDIDARRLRNLIGVDDIAQLDDPALAAIAARLKDKAGANEDGSGHIAARAMSLLLAFATSVAQNEAGR